MSQYAKAGLKRVALSLSACLALNLAVVVGAVVPSQGCAAIVSALPAVISAVTDASLVLSTIESFVNTYFAQPAHVDLEKQKAVNLAITRARTSLDAALRIAHGAEKLDQAKVDEAFAEFKIAYTELIGMVDSIGIKSGPEKRMMAGPNTLTVPEPLALSLKVK